MGSVHTQRLFEDASLCFQGKYKYKLKKKTLVSMGLAAHLANMLAVGLAVACVSFHIEDKEDK